MEKNHNRSVRGKMIDEEFQGESKVENRLRIEGRGIEKKIKCFKEERSWTEKKENKLQTLRSLRLMECTPAGQSTPATHWCQEIR